MATMNLLRNDSESFVRALRPDQRGVLWDLVKNEVIAGDDDRIRKVPRFGRSIPLSLAQERLWFVERLRVAPGLYNIASHVTWHGALDLAALRRAFAEVVRRHEIFRTSFGLQDGQPIQIVHEETELDFRTEDLRSAPESERPSMAQVIARQAGLEPFDLGRPSLLRVVLTQLSQAEHQCTIVLHHLVSDGWSQDVLLRELNVLYEAYRQGDPSTLPELEIQYADYALWQRRADRDQELRSSTRYWKATLEGIEDLNTIPGDHPRPRVQTFRGAHLSFLIPTQEVATLRKLGGDTGATLFMTLLACFGVLIRIYSGQVRPVIGTPVANRERSELEPLIGFFVNTLILRLDLDDQSSIREAVRTTRDMAVRAFAHQELPFERLVEELNPLRSLGSNPIVQLMFTLQNASTEVNWSDVDLAPDQFVLTEGTLSKYDLSLMLVETGQGSLRGQFEYSTDLFEHATVERMAHHLRAIVVAFGANPDLAVGRIDVTTRAERKIMAGWTNQAPRRATTLLDVWQRAVRRFDRMPAWIDEAGSTIEYRELDQEADDLGQHLDKATGRVGVCLGSGVQRVAWLLAIAKAGGVFVPLDPRYPEPMLRQAARSAGLDLLISDLPVPWFPEDRTVSPSDHRSSADDGNGRTAGATRATPDANDPVLAVPSWDASGEIRWFDVRHGALTRVTADQNRILPVEPGFSLMPTSPTMGEMWIWEVLLALAHGGTLLEVGADLATAHGVAEAVTRHPVDALCLEDGLLRQLAPATFENVRWLVAYDVDADAPVPKHELAWQLRCDTPADYCNLLGPRTAPRFLWGADADRLRLVDSAGRPVPLGAAGELQVAAESNSIPVATTGLRARRSANGGLRVLCDRRRSLLRAGLRVDPAGVEHMASAHPAIEAAVLDPNVGSWTLHVVLKNGPAARKRIPKGGLRKRLRGAFPTALHPVSYAAIDAIPRTADGRKDRRFRAGDQVGVEIGETDWSSPTERGLAEIWCQTLGIDEVRPDSDFFELGGHSLLGAQILARIHEVFGVDLSLRRLFDARTVTEMAVHIDRADRVDTEPNLPNLVEQDRAPSTQLGFHPASFAQQRMWLLDQSFPASALYNVPGTLAWPGSVDTSALQRALEEITRRHETLRTSFELQRGEPVQVVHEQVEIDFRVEDLGRLPTKDRDREATRLAVNLGRVPFDLSQAPLIRSLLVRLEPDRHRLTLVLHHIIADAWSQDVLMRELQTLYASFAEGRASSLPPLPIQYADFAREQRRKLQGEKLEELLGFWRRELAGIEPQNALPTDHPRPRASRHAGARLSFRIPAEEVAPLRAVSRDEGATLFTTLLTCFGIVTRIHTGRDRPVFGTPVAGRGRPELDSLIGFFVNTLVLRLDLSAEINLREAVRSTSRMTLRAFAHQDLPFERLVDALSTVRSEAQNPLFQTLFTTQGPPPEGQPDPESPSGIQIEEGVLSKFDLSLSLFDSREGNLHGRLEFDIDLFEPSTAERLVEHFRAVVCAFGTDIDQPLSAVRLESVSDLAAREAWAESTRPAPSLLDAWSRCLRHSARKTAVEEATRSVTYAALNREATMMARALAERGCDETTRVGVAVGGLGTRLACLVAVAMAGGTYVPLDDEPTDDLIASWAKSACIVLLISDRVRSWHAAEATLLANEPERRDRGTRFTETPWTPRANGDRFLQPYWDPTGDLTWQPNIHRQVAGLAYMSRDDLALHRGQRVLAAAACMSEAWWLEVGLSLAVAGTLCAPSRRALRSPQEVSQAITEQNVQLLCSMAHILDGLSESALESIGTLIVVDGRVAAVQRHANQWELFGSVASGLGTVWGRRRVPGTIHVVGPRVQDLQVVDARGNELPPGAVGAVMTTGRGSLHLRGRRHLDGSIQIVEDLRRDRLVVGLRARLEGIELRVEQDPRVTAAIAHLDHGRLTLQVEPSPSPDGKARRLTKGALRKLLRTLLPGPLVPESIDLVDQVPRVDNGLKDRRAASLETAPITSGGAVYEAVRRIWCAVLDREDIDAETDFFAVGGNSLLATRAVAHLRRDLMLDVSVGLMFAHPRLGAAAAAIEAQSTGISRSTELRRGDRRNDHAPTSYSQERLWFLCRLHPDSLLYNVSAGFRWREALRPDTLQSALDLIVQRHETLRTTFGMRHGLPVQIIADSVEVPIAFHDISNRPREERGAMSRKIAHEEGLRPFDLEHGPLFRVCLIRLDKHDHLFVYSLHHIVSDAWSQGILLHEIETLYQEASQGLPRSLPELEIQFRDYARWQRRLLSGEALDALLSFWRDELQGSGTLCTLPTDYPRPSVQSFAGAQINFLIPKAEAEPLRRLSGEEGASLFMTLLTAFGLLIRIYTGIDRPVFGTPIANRTRAELEGLIGFFVNTLALRLDLEGEPTFRQALRSTRDATLRAFEHQDLPFERLVEHLQPDRDLASNPIFQLMFVLQNAPEGTRWSETTLGGEELVVTTETFSKFDITLSLTETVEGSLLGQLEYCTDLYASSTMERLITHYRALLRSDPDVLPSRASVLGPEEVKWLQSLWRSRPGPPTTLVDLLARGEAATKPDALALDGDGGSRTYDELATAVDLRARTLRDRGVGRGSRVGIHLDRGPNLIESIVATLQTGAIYVPLARSYPAARLGWMAENAALDVLIASEPVEWFPADRTLFTDASSEAIDDDRHAAPQPVPEDGAYLLYTSGSTGRPKGVLMSHGPLAGLIEFQLEQLPGPRRILQFAPASFDVSAQEILTALASGGTLVSINDDVRRDPEALWDTVARDRIDTLFVPYVMLAELAEAAAKRSCLPSCLKDIVTAGEQVHVTTRLRRLFERLDGTRLINQYGPTETHVVTYWVIEGPPHHWPAKPPIGRPIPGACTTVRDRHGRLVPQGVTGELYLGGPCLADGYWSNPELTAERFIEIADDPTTVRRWYRTGDLVRLSPDGNLDFLGRFDDQIKIRGHAVTLGEIEATLSSFDDVAEVAVVVRDEPGRPRALAAYLVLSETADNDLAPRTVRINSLRERLRSSLPDYMVPDHLVRLETLPKTPSGKIDRSALPRPNTEVNAHSVDDTPLEYEAEHQVAAIWTDLLMVETVGAQQDFFDLGGHSLLATRAISRINDDFGLSLPLRAIFAESTVRGMASLICARYLDHLSSEKRAAALDLIQRPSLDLQEEHRC